MDGWNSCKARPTMVKETTSFDEVRVKRSENRVWVLSFVVGLTFVLAGCGGTWVDDAGNFKRVFGISQPPDVRVVHSYYWKSPHWSTEYRYFIAIHASSKFSIGLTSSEVATAVAPDTAVLDRCGSDRPQWFLPKALEHYEMWIPKAAGDYRMFRDKANGVLFVCDQQL